ncbi:MAG: CaiB/BaiF CoA transferase family protein [Leptonema sp. (in: bacteria)]
MEILEYKNENNSPLKGIRVLDFSMLLPGPLCTLYLGDLGAEVLKVEHPVAYDGTRKIDSSFSNKQQSFHYYLLNRNKKSLSVNFKKKEGVEVLKKLIPHIDIVVEGFRPNMMKELGLGYEELSKINPQIIYASISGYGLNSDYQDFAGHDANYLALSGILDLIGDSKPILPAVQIADILGGTMVALSSILAALYYREKTGKGQHLDISIMDGAFSLAILPLADLISSKKEIERNQTYLSGKLPNYNVYQCKEGRYVVLAALEGQFFSVFLKQIQREDLLQKALKGNYEEVKNELANFFKDKTYQDLEPLFNNPNVCLSPVLTLQEAFERLHFLKRGTVIQINDKELGILKVPGSPFSFSESSVSYRLPPPKLGEHTKEILQKYCQEKEILELESKKIIYIHKL